MKKWNKLIALGMISVVLAAQAAGCGSKQEEGSSLSDTVEGDKEMDALAENNAETGDAESSENGSETGDTESSEEETESESSSEPDIIPWEEAGLEDHVMDWKGQDGMEHEMRSRTGIMEGDLMLSDVWEITYIEVGMSRWGYTDDLSPLVELENLTTLFLTDICDASELKQVKTLYLMVDLGNHNDNITKIGFLSEMENLTELNLDDTGISDLTPLVGLNNLERLSLIGSKATDVSPLAELTNLKELDLSYNEGITDISPLAELTNLEELNLKNDEGITDYSPVSFVEWVYY